MAPVTEFKLVRAGDFALVTIDNGEDWTKPTFFGEQALESLGRLLGELEGSDYGAAVSHIIAPGATETTLDFSAARRIAATWERRD